MNSGLQLHMYDVDPPTHPPPFRQGLLWQVVVPEISSQIHMYIIMWIYFIIYAFTHMLCEKKDDINSSVTCAKKGAPCYLTLSQYGQLPYFVYHHCSDTIYVICYGVARRMDV